MHSLARRYLKTAIVFLVAGLALGVWLLVRREVGGAAISARELSAHTHALLVGFVMMMIAGVAIGTLAFGEVLPWTVGPAAVLVLAALLLLQAPARTPRTTPLRSCPGSAA